MGVNLYAPVPMTDQGGGLAVLLGRALSKPPVVLAVHAVLGLLLLAGAVGVLARAVGARLRRAIVTSAAGLAAITGAGLSGAAFVGRGQADASMAMASSPGSRSPATCSILSRPAHPAMYLEITSPDREQ